MKLARSFVVPLCATIHLAGSTTKIVSFSLATDLYGLGHHRNTRFYLASHRAWELLLGALLRNTAAGYAPKPDYRPLTKFENRGLKLGHGVWDVVFARR